MHRGSRFACIGAARTARAGRVFHRDQRIVLRRHLQQQFNIQRFGPAQVDSTASPAFS